MTVMNLCLQYVAISVNPDQLMSFGGSTDACAVCHFGNIGRIDNRAFSKQAMDKISKDLHISSSRFEFYVIWYTVT